MKELATEFEGQFECLRENAEKYVTFSVPVKEELDNGKTITYKLEFIDSLRSISTSLSKLVDNLSEIYRRQYIETKTFNLSVRLKVLKTANFFIIAKGVETNS